jgi:hypothetical protein
MLNPGPVLPDRGVPVEYPGPEDLTVASILNWSAISDVNELLEDPAMPTYTVTWLGSTADRDQVAKRVSPLTYVRAGLPPIVTISNAQELLALAASHRGGSFARTKDPAPAQSQA